MPEISKPAKPAPTAFTRSTDTARADGRHGPFGDSVLHLPLADLEVRCEAFAPPKDAGELALIVSRGEEGIRTTPREVRLTPEEGVPGDAWRRKAPSTERLRSL